MRNNEGRDSKKVTPEHKDKVLKEMDAFISAMNAEYEKDIIHIQTVDSKPRTFRIKK